MTVCSVGFLRQVNQHTDCSEVDLVFYKRSCLARHTCRCSWLTVPRETQPLHSAWLLSLAKQHTLTCTRPSVPSVPTRVVFKTPDTSSRTNSGDEAVTVQGEGQGGTSPESSPLAAVK